MTKEAFRSAPRFFVYLDEDYPVRLWDLGGPPDGLARTQTCLNLPSSKFCGGEAKAVARRSSLRASRNIRLYQPNVRTTSFVPFGMYSCDSSLTMATERRARCVTRILLAVKPPNDRPDRRTCADEEAGVLRGRRKTRGADTQRESTFAGDLDLQPASDTESKNFLSAQEFYSAWGEDFWSLAVS